MNTIKLILITIVFSLLSQSCHKGGPWGIKGKGDNITQTKDLNGFDKINLSIDADIFYTQDSIFKVEITAQENILAVLKAEVNGNTLSFDYRRNVWDHNKVKITVHSPTMNRLNISGSGDITCENTLNTNSMEINVSGSGSVFLPFLIGEDLKTTISGSGDVKITGGKLSSENFNVSGSGNIDTEGIQTESSAVKISGSGNITVYVTENLTSTISGSGNVRYKGKPTVTSTISGSGSLIHID